MAITTWSPYLREALWRNKGWNWNKFYADSRPIQTVAIEVQSNLAAIFLSTNQPTGQSVFLVGARIRNFNGSLTARADWGGGERLSRHLCAAWDKFSQTLALTNHKQKQKQTFKQMFDFWTLILVSRHSPSDWKEFSKQLWLFTETNHIAYMVGMNIVESLICDAFAKRGNSRNLSHWTWFIVSFSAKAFKVAWLLS